MKKITYKTKANQIRPAYKLDLSTLEIMLYRYRDKTLLKSIIRKVMDYMLPLEESKDDTFYHDSLTSSSFEDVLRVTKFFSKETIDLINSNFELYKRATIEMARVKELLKSVIYKD